MVIVECCAWCGGPHQTVINCERAKRLEEYDPKNPRRDCPWKCVCIKNGELK